MSKNEEEYERVIEDLCARIDLAVSALLNVSTDLTNAKAHYLQYLGRVRQKRDSEKQEKKES